ncbi:sensor histidine kinase [Vibrio cholerae]|nr:sensor histidine kinase [Vibrio cholerae]GIA66205.1 sensor histidine kinase [Vibrio cholerae]GIB08575.1 sensor histidine kinase [Vibrio cholerae]
MVTRLNEAHKALILVALYAMVTVVGVMYRKDMIETDVAMLFLLLNILSASVLKPRNAYLMMGLSIIDYHYFLLPDYQSFRFENAQYVITYAVLAFSGIFAVNITQAQRKQIEKNKRLQQQHKKYYELACHLSALSTSEDIAQATVKFLSKEKGIVSAIALYQLQW